MPRIQTYERRYSIPGEAGSVAEPVKSAGIIGAAVEDLGRSLYDHAEKLQKQKEDNELIETGAKINDAVSTWEIDYKKNNKGGSAVGSMDKANTFLESLRETYKSANPRLSSKINSHIASVGNSLKNSLAHYEAAELKSYATDVRALDLESSKKMAQTGDYRTAAVNYQKTLDAQKANGSLSAEEHKIEMIKGKSLIAESYLDAVVNRNPSGAIELIKSGVFTDSLTSDKVDEFSRKATDLVEAQKRDAEHQQRERDRELKEKLKAHRENIGNDFVVKHVSGKLTRADVIRSDLEPTGENSKQYWLNQIEEREKKLKSQVEGGGDGFKTNKVLSARLYSRIVRDPESVTEDEILNYIGNGLSESKGDEFIKERRTRLKEPKDPGEQAVYDNLKRDRKAGVFGKDQEGDLEYAKQVEAFKKWRRTNKDKDASEYYEKIMAPYVRTLWFDKVDPKQRRIEMQKGQNKPDPLGIRR